MPDVTVLYDERCVLCAGLSARLAGANGVSLAPIGSERGELLLRDLPPSERYASIHVVDRAGRRRSGAAGIALILRTRPAGRLPARLIEMFPETASRAYRLTARSRARLSRLQVCSLSGATRASRARAG